MKLTSRIAAFAALAATVGSAQAVNLTITLSVDNFYTLYRGTSTTALQVIGSDYGWATGETYNVSLNTGEYLYVAAWGDDGGLNGFLSEVTMGSQTIYSQDPQWKVAATGVDLDLAGQDPSLADLSTQIQFANAGTNPSAGWVNPVAGPNNGSLWPFPVTNISTAAQWTWYDSNNSGYPFWGAYHDEYLIFRLDPEAVPEPGTLAALAVGAAGLARRRRRP